jgi:hypothetical protein
MKTRLELLLEKYWEAESTIEEEKELKSLLHQAKGYEEEKALFGILSEFKKMEPQSVQLPGSNTKRTINWSWIGWAASVAILASSVWVWQEYEQKKEEELAYQQVMEALALIQNNLAKGQQQLQPLHDLKYLNTTNQLFQKETEE